MRGRLASLGALTALAMAAAAPGALAQGPGAAAAKTVPPPNLVSELVVIPHPKCIEARPDFEMASARIVSTFPETGATVRPGLLVVRVTFDRPMTCKGFLEAAPPLPSPCPDGQQQMVLSLDRRTVHTLCLTQPNRTYGLRTSEALGRQFVALNGAPTRSYGLTFATSAGPPVETIPEALAQDPSYRPAQRLAP